MLEGALGGAIVAAVVAAGGWWARSYLEFLGKRMAEAHSEAQVVARRVEAQEKVLDQLVAQTAALEGAKLAARVEGLQGIIHEQGEAARVREEARLRADTHRTHRLRRVDAYTAYLEAYGRLIAHMRNRTVPNSPEQLVVLRLGDSAAEREWEDTLEESKELVDDINSTVLRVYLDGSREVVACHEKVTGAWAEAIVDAVDRAVGESPAISDQTALALERATSGASKAMREMMQRMRAEMGMPHDDVELHAGEE